jgi:uncharacterized protein YcbK (DUF882 family)
MGPGVDRAARTLASRRSILSSGIAASFLFLVDPAMAAHRIAPERHLHLYNPHSGERFRDVYWSRGRYVRQAFHRVDRLMRDNYNGDMHAIDPALLDLLYALQMKTEAGFRPIQVNSGYRSRETNEMLREEGYGAVPDSMHLFGKAADIQIPGVRLDHLHRAAVSLRVGGVGYYPDMDFVHVDTGALRQWEY